MSRTPMSRMQIVGLNAVMGAVLLATAGGLRSEPADARGIILLGPHAVRELLPAPTVAVGIIMHGRGALRVVVPRPTVAKGIILYGPLSARG